MPGSFLAGTVGMHWAGTLLGLGAFVPALACLTAFDKLEAQSKTPTELV